MVQRDELCPIVRYRAISPRSRPRSCTWPSRGRARRAPRRKD